MYRLFLALRYLRSRLVNLISVCGVMAGVAVLIVVTSIMDGFQDQVRRVARGNLSDLTLYPIEDPVPWRELDRVLRARDDRIEATAPMARLPIAYFFDVSQGGAYRIGGRPVWMMEAHGVEWDAERKVSDVEDYLLYAYDRDDPFHHPKAEERRGGRTALISRRFAEKFYGAITPAEIQALIGRDLPVKLVIEQAEEGTFRPQAYNLVISGIYDGADAAADVQRIFVDLDRLREMSEVEGDYSEVRIKLAEDADSGAVKAELNDRLEGRYVAQTWEDQRDTLLRAVQSEKVMLVVVLSFIVLLAGSIILATLTLTVVEKTRDIGILAALGASKPGILSLFLSTGALIGAVGGVLGIGLGWLFVDNVNWVRERLEDMGLQVFHQDIYHFRQIPTVWDWSTILFIAGGSTLVAFLAGLPPALRAAHLQPVSALRHE